MKESKWNWFYQMVELEIEPVLERFGFYRLTGPGYEGGDNIDWKVGYFYEHTKTKKKALIDLLTYDEGPPGNRIDYYLVRPGITGMDIKRFMYPDHTDTAFLRNAWKCYTEAEVQEVLKEIAGGLEKLLNEFPELHS